MIEERVLREFFSRFWDVKVEDVADDLMIDSRIPSFTSIRLYQFLAAVESNFGVIVENVHKIRSFGDLRENIKSG